MSMLLANFSMGSVGYHFMTGDWKSLVNHFKIKVGKLSSGILEFVNVHRDMDGGFGAFLGWAGQFLNIFFKVF